MGRFPALWSEWNGRYRDTVRDFWRGSRHALPDFATRIAGSSDLYGAARRRPSAPINFITAHDGFTLRVLVSCNREHNQANGEGNRDGASDNRSWNCGKSSYRLRREAAAPRTGFSTSSSVGEPSVSTRL